MNNEKKIHYHWATVKNTTEAEGRGSCGKQTKRLTGDLMKVTCKKCLRCEGASHLYKGKD